MPRQENLRFPPRIIGGRLVVGLQHVVEEAMTHSGIDGEFLTAAVALDHVAEKGHVRLREERVLVTIKRDFRTSYGRHVRQGLARPGFGERRIDDDGVVKGHRR